MSDEIQGDRFLATDRVKTGSSSCSGTFPCYADDFHPGDELLYNGPLPIRGTVTVMAWTPDEWRNEGCVGDFRLRLGLVPVFSYKFPETRFWWVSKFQVTKA